MNSKERTRRELHADVTAKVHRYWCDDAREEWEERAAIMEYDGGMNRIDAETRAVKATRESRQARGLEITKQ